MHVLPEPILCRRSLIIFGGMAGEVTEREEATEQLVSNAMAFYDQDEGGMQDLINRLIRVNTRTEVLAKQLSARFGRADNEVPISALNMSHQHIVLSIELCSYYAAIWMNQNVPVGVDIERIRQDNAERIAATTKSMLIFSLSSMEFAAKSAAQQNNQILSLDWSRRQYFAGIMRKSHALGIIDAKAMELWTAIVELRNCLIHNNGIADQTMIAQFPEFRISMQIGQMTKGDNLFHFIDATSWAVESYADWCKAFLEKA